MGQSVSPVISPGCVGSGAGGIADTAFLAISSPGFYCRVPASSGPVLTKGLIVPVSGGGMPVYWITEPKHPCSPPSRRGG